MEKIYMKKNEYNNFLKGCSISKQQKDKIIPTNTSIKGGSYYIQDEQINRFYALYYDHVFVKKNKEYLTVTR